ncbi:MAG: potassium channel family protein [Candidatus Marinarcus sp.]|uniref:potassium channel family protein n=1 Tax=Candidatus Marinarcus sp. TaxID=3100987 RepID=UPI003AFFF97B
MNNKVIIFGYGNLGQKIVQVLENKKYELVIVESDKKLFAKAMSDGFKNIYNYDLMNDSELIEVGIQENIKAFFCVTTSDNNNLFVTLSVRNLNKHVKIISNAHTAGDSKKMILAGANKIINSYEIGALRIFRMLHKPLILEILDNILFSDSQLNIAEFTIEKRSILNGKFLKEINFSRENRILVIGITDREIGENFIFNASGINHKIDEGDTLVVMGYREDLNQFKKVIEGNSL